MKVITVKSEAEFINLRDLWNNIVNEMEDSTPFQTWEWNYYYWKLIGSQCILNILLIISNETIIGIAPLMINNGVISFIGSNFADYGGFIIKQNTYRVLSLFLKSLEQQNWKRIELRDFCSRYTQIHSLKRLYHNDSRAYCQQSLKTVNIPLKRYSDWNEYYNSLTRNMRKKDIAPILKMNLQYTELTELDQKNAENLFNIYGLRQAQRVGKSNLAWFIPIATELHKTKNLFTTLLKDGETTVGFATIFRFKKKKYVWVTGYDPKQSRIGHLLSYHIIRQAFNENITDVDRMRGDYDYKIRWNGEVFTNYHFILFKNSFQRNLYALKMFIRKRLSSFINSHNKIKNIYKKISKLSFNK